MTGTAAQLVPKISLDEDHAHGGDSDSTWKHTASCRTERPRTALASWHARYGAGKRDTGETAAMLSVHRIKRPTTAPPMTSAGLVEANDSVAFVTEPAMQLPATLSALAPPQVHVSTPDIFARPTPPSTMVHRSPQKPLTQPGRLVGSFPTVTLMPRGTPQGRHFDLPGWFQFHMAGHFSQELAYTTPYVAVTRPSHKKEEPGDDTLVRQPTVPRVKVESLHAQLELLSDLENVELRVTAQPDLFASKSLENALSEARSKFDPTSLSGLQLMAAGLAQRLEQKKDFQRCVRFRDARKEAFRRCSQIVDALRGLVAAAAETREDPHADAQGVGLRRTEFFDLHRSLVRGSFFKRGVVGKDVARAPHCYAPPAYLGYAIDTGKMVEAAERAMDNASGTISLEAVGHIDQLLPMIPKEHALEPAPADESADSFTAEAAPGLATWDAGVEMWTLLIERGKVQHGLLTLDGFIDIVFELADATISHRYRQSFVKSRKSPAMRERALFLQEYFAFVTKLVKACVRDVASSSLAPSRVPSLVPSQMPSLATSVVASPKASARLPPSASVPSLPTTCRPTTPNAQQRPTTPNDSSSDEESFKKSKDLLQAAMSGDAPPARRRGASRLRELRESRELVDFDPEALVETAQPEVGLRPPEVETPSSTTSPLLPTRRRSLGDLVAKAGPSTASPLSRRRKSWTDVLALAVLRPQSRMRYSWPRPGANAEDCVRKLELLRDAIKSSDGDSLNPEGAKKVFRSLCQLNGKRRGPLGYGEIASAFRRMPGDAYANLSFRHAVVGRELSDGAVEQLRAAKLADEDQFLSFLRGLDLECEGYISESSFCHAVVHGLAKWDGMDTRWHLAAMCMQPSTPKMNERILEEVELRARVKHGLKLEQQTRQEMRG